MARARMLLTAAVLAAFTLAAGARAADHTATLGPGKTVFEWDGAPDVGANQFYVSDLPCDVTVPTTACEETLINVDVADGTGVTLTVHIAETGDDDFDLYLYKSDAEGSLGDEVAVSDEAAPSPEQVTVPNAKGFYLARVVYYANIASSYHGTATLTGVPETVESPAAPAPEATPSPSPAGQPAPAPPAQGGPPPPAPAPSPPPAAAPPRAADLTAALAVHRIRTRTARRRGLAVRLTCSEVCNAALGARIDARTARRLGLGRRSRGIGRVAVQASPELGRHFRLQLDARARHKLRRGTRITVVATVTDPDGRRALRITDAVTLR